MSLSAAHEAAVSVVLAAATLAAVVSSIGLLRMRHPLDRLHYVGVATTLAPALFAIAGLLQNQSAVDGIKSVLIALVLCVTSPATTHVIARAIRARDTGALALDPADAAAGPDAADATRGTKGTPA